METKDCHSKADFLIETSWEVCNKIGGIYAVLSTKAATLQKIYKDNIIFIGPDVWTATTPCPVFTESKQLLSRWKKNADLPHGITVRTGRWEIPGRPIAILVSFSTIFPLKNDFYGEMWDKFGVDSLHAYGDYDEACMFSIAAGMVIESLSVYLSQKTEKRLHRPANILAHFDEWTTGMGLLYVKSQCKDIATVFTTHATSIGRSICGNGKELYKYLDRYDGGIMARELNMEAKHSLEKSAACNADAFTTVSQVTARECECLLAVKPFVTPNGFESTFVPEGKDYVAARKLARERIIDVASALTGRKYEKDVFIVATSGRCEYRNKGIDIYIDAMASLDDRLPVGKDLISLILVPAWHAGTRMDLENALRLPSSDRQPLPDPVITHALHNYHDDLINRRIHQVGFADGKKMTLIYVPCYLDNHDGVFNLAYYDLLPGLDTTVFPSYYEPWGYTPLESIAFGIPTVTTSLSGFGQWILDNFKNSFEDCGVRVVNRNDDNYHEVVNSISSDLYGLMMLPPSKRRKLGEVCQHTASLASWQYFIEFYNNAYRHALSQAGGR